MTNMDKPTLPAASRPSGSAKFAESVLRENERLRLEIERLEQIVRIHAPVLRE